MNTVPFAFVVAKFNRACINGEYASCAFPVDDASQIVLVRLVQQSRQPFFSGYANFVELEAVYGVTKEGMEERIDNLREVFEGHGQKAPPAPLFLSGLAEFFQKIGGFSWKESFDKRK